MRLCGRAFQCAATAAEHFARAAADHRGAPYQPDKGAQGAGAPYNAAAKFYDVYIGDTAHDHDLRVSHVAIDRAHLSDDSGTWFPLPALRRALQRGRIGALTPRFIGVPTNRSQRHTLAVDAPQVVALCHEDAADAAVLVPNCPVCHQTMALMARHIEAAGIATVILGAAEDIVERVPACRGCCSATCRSAMRRGCRMTPPHRT